MEKPKFKLTEFEGPLDLLLYLISKHKLDILDISISELLKQYMDFIKQAGRDDLDVKSEFLEMASRLLYIKTVSMLPRHEEEAQQLKSALQCELMELSLCRKAADCLEKMAKNNVVFVRDEAKLEESYPYSLIHDKRLLSEAVKISKGRLIRKLPPREECFSPIVKRRIVSVESRIIFLLGIFYKKNDVSFDEIFSQSLDKSEVIATFLALLELIRLKRIEGSEDGSWLHFAKSSSDLRV